MGTAPNVTKTFGKRSELLPGPKGGMLYQGSPTMIPTPGPGYTRAMREAKKRESEGLAKLQQATEKRLNEQSDGLVEAAVTAWNAGNPGPLKELLARTYGNVDQKIVHSWGNDFLEGAKATLGLVIQYIPPEFHEAALQSANIEGFTLNQARAVQMALRDGCYVQVHEPETGTEE